MRLVVDASVAIKWVVPEADSVEAIAIRRHEMIAPELVLSECCNALWRLRRRDPATSAAALQSLDALLAVRFTLMPARTLVRRALEIALGLDHPAYDTLYLAMAEAYSAKVVTADARLLNKIADTPYAHLTIRLQDAAAN